MVIGKSAKPRRFPRDMSTLPTDYDFSNKAWMTKNIMGRWLCKCNRQLKSSGKHILLLLDNAPSHPKQDEISNLNLSHIKIHYMPANTTSICQPADEKLNMQPSGNPRYSGRILGDQKFR